MFDHRHYVAAMKWKKGEQDATKKLAADVKAAVTPLIEIVPVARLDVAEGPSTSLGNHLTGVESEIAEWWGSSPAFVDLGLLQGDLRMPTGRHPVLDLFERLAGVDTHAVPVTALDRDAEFNTAVQTVAEHFGTGACVRVHRDDIFGSGLWDDLADTINELKVDRSYIDLVFDLREVDSANIATTRLALTTVISSFDGLRDFRSFTLLGGGFPVNLSGFGALEEIPRSEWLLWRELIKAKLPRLPAYGDYGPRHPDLPDDLDPRIIKPSASIRYCSEIEWVVVRGRNVKDHRYGGYAQFRELSGNLMRDKSYSGKDYSSGDAFIAACAGGGKTGNLTTWVDVAENRHITFAARQVAKIA